MTSTPALGRRPEPSISPAPLVPSRDDAADPADAMFAAVAVDLLSRRSARRIRRWLGGAELRPDELAVGARRAISLRLAGIYRLGLTWLDLLGAVSGALADELEHAGRAEVADSLVSSRQISEALRAIAEAGIRPVVLKGRPLAERLWPRSWMRPAGDLDLLVEEEALGDAVGALARLGLRPAQGEAPGRWRPAPTGVDLWRSGPGASVDLHTRLFRTVGSGFAAREALSRAVPGSLLGLPVRLLSPADEILFLLIHAAKHGAVRIHWLLDLHAACRVHPAEAWAEAVNHALAARSTRPIWAVGRLLGRALPLAAREWRAIRPSLPARLLLPALVRVSATIHRDRLAPWPSYALEWLLEDSLARRMTRLGGLGERLLLTGSRAGGGDRTAAAVESTQSDRWLERALRSRDATQWITLEGSSMVPSLRPGDELLLRPVRPGEALREGELLVVRRAGRLVVHRLVRKRGEEVVLRGDGAWSDDSPITDREVLARVIEFRRRAAPFGARPEKDSG